MGLEGKGPQKSRQLELPQESRGETPRVERSEEAPTATYEDERSGTSGLMELVCERRNLQAALKRVRKNKGSAGIDGMTVEELPEHLRAHWSELREHLLSGAYRPSMVKEQQIPKGNGEMRKLGIPTVLDRFIQQALLQVLQPIYDPSFEGTPQGGPLSPLLANVLLDEVDKELEKRGHAFVRYADDCNVYVRSKRAGERVMGLLRRLYARLRLRINESKSAIDFATNRKLLGYSFWMAPGRVVKRRVAKKALITMKERVRLITRRSGGRSIEQVARDLRSYLVGWKEYFRLADTPRILGELDQWIRHRLRAIHLKHWKRGTTIFRELRARGLSVVGAAKVASNGRRWWRNSAMLIHVAFPISYFDRLGIPRLAP